MTLQVERRPRLREPSVAASLRRVPPTSSGCFAVAVDATVARARLL